MYDGAVAGTDDFEEGMGVRCTALEFDGQGCEEEDLDRCAWYSLVRGLDWWTGGLVYLCIV
jgi:hypothetical protein